MRLGKAPPVRTLRDMFVHSVYFWLRDDLTVEEKEEFLRGVHSLGAIETIESIHIGKPADTHRPVIDRSYSVGLTVILKDLAAHDAYQVHPLHKAFVEQFHHCWERVLIYDHE